MALTESYENFDINNPLYRENAQIFADMSAEELKKFISNPKINATPDYVLRTYIVRHAENLFPEMDLIAAFEEKYKDNEPLVKKFRDLFSNIEEKYENEPWPCEVVSFVADLVEQLRITRGITSKLDMNRLLTPDQTLENFYVDNIIVLSFILEFTLEDYIKYRNVLDNQGINPHDCQELARLICFQSPIINNYKSFQKLEKALEDKYKNNFIDYVLKIKDDELRKFCKETLNVSSFTEKNKRMDLWRWSTTFDSFEPQEIKAFYKQLLEMIGGNNENRNTGDAKKYQKSVHKLEEAIKSVNERVFLDYALEIENTKTERLIEFFEYELNNKNRTNVATDLWRWCVFIKHLKPHDIKAYYDEVLALVQECKKERKDAKIRKVNNVEQKTSIKETYEERLLTARELLNNTTDSFTKTASNMAQFFETKQADNEDAIIKTIIDTLAMYPYELTMKGKRIDGTTNDGSNSAVALYTLLWADLLTLYYVRDEEDRIRLDREEERQDREDKTSIHSVHKMNKEKPEEVEETKEVIGKMPMTMRLVRSKLLDIDDDNDIIDKPPELNENAPQVLIDILNFMFPRKTEANKTNNSVASVLNRHRHPKRTEILFLLLFLLYGMQFDCIINDNPEISETDKVSCKLLSLKEDECKYVYDGIVRNSVQILNEEIEKGEQAVYDQKASFNTQARRITSFFNIYLEKLPFLFRPIYTPNPLDRFCVMAGLIPLEDVDGSGDYQPVIARIIRQEVQQREENKKTKVLTNTGLQD